ncbi:MAG: MarR family transcriptional regulator [Myxococcota bacterium]
MTTPDARIRLERSLATGFARVCQIYGIPDVYGRIYATLYASPRPITLEELADGVGLAKSTVSVAVRALERYRFVVRLPRQSDRKARFVAITDPMDVLRDLCRYFVEPELEVGSDMIDDLRRELGAAVEAGAYTEEDARVLEHRAGELAAALAQGRALIGQLLRDDEGE